MTNKELISKIREEILHLKMKELQRTNGINTGADVYLSSYAVLSILSNALTEESEDERIRKWLADYFSSIKKTVWIHRDITCGQILAWLENQKESLHISESCKENADSFTDENERVRKVIFKLLLGMREEIFTSQDEIVTKEKALAYLKKKPGIKIWPHPIKDAYLEQKEQKPAWSEEDADILNCCISSIEEAKENRYAYKETDGDTSYDHEIDWLKSLRPSWKPNEEQMDALQHAIDACESEWAYQDDELRSLLNDIKKL